MSIPRPFVGPIGRWLPVPKLLRSEGWCPRPELNLPGALKLSR